MKFCSLQNENEPKMLLAARMLEFAPMQWPQVTKQELHSHSGENTGLVRRVPQLDLKRQYELLRDEILAALERVCASQQFILGTEVAALEQEISTVLGVAETVACASGTDALWLALVASGVQPGDMVATTPFSFFASTSAIVRAGARPVFVDVDPQTLNLSLERLRQRLAAGAGIRAVLPVHLYGQCVDMEELSRLARAHNLIMIEDAAQAFGAGWQERKAGRWGDAAAFSFYPTKNLSAYGDAGCITTQDKPTAERLRRLRNHGSRDRYFHEEIGWNCRLDALQAAVLRVKLKHIDEWNCARRERAATYDRLLAKAGLIADGAQSPIQLLRTADGAFHIFHQYVVRARERDPLRSFLAERGVGTEIYYPLPLHLQKCFTYLGYRQGDFPEAERAAREVLALPMFPELTENEQQYVIESIAEFYS
jgi:dTDP-4-amino-4,6-dideoxygalactose transaminase